MATTSPAAVRIMLVHSEFMDGSSWKDVYDLLRRDGYDVSVVQNPTVSLAGDVAAVHRAIDAQVKPIILVGHSYGGAVITEAGTHHEVKALVYIAAFALEKGESVRSLTDGPPPGVPVPPILPPRDGFQFLDREKFPKVLAGDLPRKQAEFLAHSQVPWGVEALSGMVIKPAWRVKPSWYLVATDDQMIPPPVQRAMAERVGANTIEVAASHAIHVSQPAAVARFIDRAAQDTLASSRDQGYLKGSLPA